jgi:hypothetical protein
LIYSERSLVLKAGWSRKPSSTVRGIFSFRPSVFAPIW